MKTECCVPWLWIAITLAFLPLGAVGCSGCEEQDDETVIRGMVNRAADLAAKHELGELMQMTAEGFVANPGQRSRQEVRPILLMAFRRYGKFSVEHPRPAVDLDPSGLMASAEMPFLIVREGAEVPNLGELIDDPEGWFEEASEQADAYYLDLTFKKTDDGWRVSKAKIGGTRGVGAVRGF